MTQHQQPQEYSLESLFKAFLDEWDESLGKMFGLRLGIGPDIDVVQDDWPRELIERLLRNGVRPIRIDPEAGEARRVVAIDTSSIRVAVGVRGVVSAIRGAMIVRENSGIWGELIGPLMIYIDEENLRGLLSSMLGQPMAEYPRNMFHNSIQKILASVLEKKIQEYAAERFEDSILLFDGSLSAGPLDNPSWIISKILRKALMRGNDVLAFSKTSILRIWGEFMTSLKLDLEPPYLVDMTWAIREIEMRVKVFGRTYLARLSSGGEGFRIDIALNRRMSEALGSLLKSDSLIHGYPETLILAHDLCTFNRVDVIAIQSLLRRKGVKLFKPTSIRGLLFKPLDEGDAL